MTSRTINLDVPCVTRVEGEGSLHIRSREGQIEAVEFAIHEPPRLFERLLIGRSCHEVPDITARICGICPLAYQLTSIQAFEQLFEIEVSPEVKQLRRLIYLGEWLQSHALHIHFLAAPDFLGCNDAFSMGAKHPELLARGMKLQRLGHKIVTLLGGRSVHPVSMIIGGISRTPEPEQWQQLQALVEENWQSAVDLLHWATSLSLPDSELPFQSVSLNACHDYAFLEGEIATPGGLLPVSDYAEHFVRIQQTHSTALYSYYDQQPFLVGPLARLNNNVTTLPSRTAALVQQLGLTFPCYNMFASLTARAVEICFALESMAAILAQPCPAAQDALAVSVREGECCFATEAPRGLIYHWYELDSLGLVKACQIIPPTAQNQAQINDELLHSLRSQSGELDDSGLQQHCERIIRNYDPCISCATHFLRITREQNR